MLPQDYTDHPVRRATSTLDRIHTPILAYGFSTVYFLGRVPRWPETVPEATDGDVESTYYTTMRDEAKRRVDQTKMPQILALLSFHQ